MIDKPIELSIDIPPETKEAIERAAAAADMAVAEFLEDALLKYLIDIDYIDEGTAH